MNIVEKMINFRESQDIKCLELESCIDIENLNVIVIEILSWLKLQHKRELWIEEGRKTKLKPMMLNEQYVWCKDVMEYVKDDNALGAVFAVSNGLLDFDSSITKEYEIEARRMAYEKYNPEKMV